MSISAAAFSSNIDLSAVYNVRQANFGLFKLGDENNSKVVDAKADEINDEAIISSDAMALLKTQDVSPQSEEQDNSKANANASSEKENEASQKKNRT